MNIIAKILLTLFPCLSGGISISAQQSYHSRYLDAAGPNSIAIAAANPAIGYGIESNLLIQDWMTDPGKWQDAEPGKMSNHSSGTNAEALRMAAVDRISAEQSLALEDWMLKPFSTQVIRLQDLVRADAEPPLKLEKWMYCCDDWKLAKR